MFWFWLFLYSCVPALYLLGMFGWLGSSAEDAAYSFVIAIGLAILVVAICVALYISAASLYPV